MDRRTGLQALLTLSAGMSGLPLRAQTGPTRIVLGFAPGGSVDALARLSADLLQPAVGAPVIVENRTGASGRLAVEQVKAAAPDGQTLLLAPQGPMTLFPHVFRHLRFDPVKDFVPVSRLATGDFALTTGPLTPARDAVALRNWLRTAGDKASFGSPGAGTLPHFVGLSIARAMGVTLTHVPYRGSALAMTDLAGGTLAAVVSPVTEALELHKSGRVRILATAGAQRSPFLDGVPTLKELGIGTEVPLWFALYAPARTPEATLDRLRRALHAGLAGEAARERLTRLGLVPAPSGGAELVAIQKREAAMWGPIVQASGFSPED